MATFRGCWSCGRLDIDVTHCGDCQFNICGAEHCQEVHEQVHADVIWHRRMDEITSDPVKWRQAVNKAFGWEG